MNEPATTQLHRWRKITFQFRVTLTIIQYLLRTPNNVMWRASGVWKKYVSKTVPFLVKKCLSWQQSGKGENSIWKYLS